MFHGNLQHNLLRHVSVSFKKLSSGSVKYKTKDCHTTLKYCYSV